MAFHYFTLKDQAALGPISLEEDQAAAELRAKLKAEREALGLDDGGGGPQMLRLVGSTSECITNSPLYITNTVCVFDTNSGWTVQFDIQGTNSPADIFTTTNLSGNNITNSQWVWLERGPSCSTYQYTNQPTAESYYILGTMLDSDGDGLTDAYERLASHTNPYTPDAPVILFQPLSQTVDEGDTVTFTVIADGAQPLSYQWLRGGTNIIGETNNWLTLIAVDPSLADDYSVLVTSPVALSTLSSNATLTVQTPANWPVVTLTGPRQDYTFKNGVTYYVGSKVELYGATTIEGGAIIKPDWYFTNSTLAVMGTLICKTDDAYAPAFITSVDDDSLGDYLAFSTGDPVPANNGAPFLDLTHAQDTRPALNNLRIRFADQGVLAPPAKTVDVWNSQFLECLSGIVASQNSGVSLHNSLFASCGAAVAGATNFTSITAEHVTAEVTNFWIQSAPSTIAFTNSIVVGAVGSGPTIVSDHSAMNPSGATFQPAGSGRFYLTNSSAYRQAGTTNVSSRLLAEFRQKTTQPPLTFPEMVQISGDLTLGPQAARYTNGAPDYGYYYPALDYTVAWITNRGTITVLPGTAIGFRNEYLPVHGRWTWWGFDVREGSSFVSHGTPTKPNIFSDVQFVQEQPAAACIASILADFWPTYEGLQAPTLDFRFSRFYAHPNWYHVWGGYDEGFFGYAASPDALVNWTMRDCAMQGGRVNLGNPDDGAFFGAPWDFFYGSGGVSWFNNSFQSVSINLDPTYFWFDQMSMNCDMQIEAYNNLVRGGLWFHLEPVPATAGNWLFKDNLFDKVDFVQDTNAPIDFDYYGFWPLSTSELGWLWNYYPWFQLNSSQLLVTTNGGGGHEPVLTSAPPYQTGPLGNFYLPTTSPLYHTGSRTPDEAGLHQYTTQTNQTKAGDEYPSGHNASIGLHYVAATNATSLLPKDSDGDGIPDYVEDKNGNGAADGDETDPALAMTDGTTPDVNSTVYDTVDLDGDGLDGISELVLGTNPLAADNPLSLSVAGLAVPVSGLVQIPLNVGSNVDTNTPVLLNVNGFSGNTRVFATNGNWFAEWDTIQFPNGTHRIDLQFQSGETSTAVGATKLVTIQNDICFPDGIPLAGDTLFVLPQTIHTNGTWALQVYDDQGNLFASTNGQVDAEGFCLDPNTSERGVSFSLLDGQGNQFPSAYYLAAVTTTNASDGSTSTATNKIGVEAPWTGNRKWVIASQPLSQFGTVVNQSIWGTMDLAAERVQDTFGIELLFDIEPQSPPKTWRLSSSSGWSTSQKWAQLAYRLGANGNTNTEARNFFFFGHFDGQNLGGTTNPAYSISVKDLRAWLGNAPDPLKGPNRHPFRFVFIDGCNSASGDLCTAFGIPKTKMTSQQMRDKGLEPRAFVGWKNVKLTNLGGFFNYAHLEFVQRFWELWPMTNTNVSPARPYTLQEALDQAYKEKAPPFFTKPETYGCPDLPYR